MNLLKSWNIEIVQHAACASNNNKKTYQIFFDMNGEWMVILIVLPQCCVTCSQCVRHATNCKWIWAFVTTQVWNSGSKWIYSLVWYASMSSTCILNFEIQSDDRTHESQWNDLIHVANSQRYLQIYEIHFVFFFFFWFSALFAFISIIINIWMCVQMQLQRNLFSSSMNCILSANVIIWLSICVCVCV